MIPRQGGFFSTPRRGGGLLNFRPQPGMISAPPLDVNSGTFLTSGERGQQVEIRGRGQCSLLLTGMKVGVAEFVFLGQSGARYSFLTPGRRGGRVLSTLRRDQFFSA